MPTTPSELFAPGTPPGPAMMEIDLVSAEPLGSNQHSRLASLQDRQPHLHQLGDSPCSPCVHEAKGDKIWQQEFVA